MGYQLAAHFLQKVWLEELRLDLLRSHSLGLQHFGGFVFGAQQDSLDQVEALDGKSFVGILGAGRREDVEGGELERRLYQVNEGKGMHVQHV